MRSGKAVASLALAAHHFHALAASTTSEQPGRLPFLSIPCTCSSVDPKEAHAFSSISSPLRVAASAIATKLLASIMPRSATDSVCTTPWTCQRCAKSRSSSMVLWSGSSRVKLVYKTSRKSETPEARGILNLNAPAGALLHCRLEHRLQDWRCNRKDMVVGRDLTI